MKICPKCSKQYDDSWKQCFQCNISLGDLPPPSSPELERFAGRVTEELSALHKRLAALEWQAGIKSPEPVEVRLERFCDNLTPASAAKQDAARASAADGSRPASNASSETHTESKTPAVAPKSDIESTIGLVWLNRIGVVALFLGMAFFLKYAFDNQWIGEAGRVIMGLMAGAALFAGAEFARLKKYDVMAQGLHGTGAAVLYLSIFAAFGLYKLIGVVPAFTFMTAVATFSAFWAVRTNWMSAAVIGVCGAFLTLAVIGAKTLPHGAVYGYIAIVDLGVLAISLKRNWRALNLISFGLSHYVFFVMMGVPGHFTENVIFALALFAIFCGLSAAHNLIRRQTSDVLDLLLVVANGLVVCSELSVILKPYAGPFPGILPLAFAMVYLAYSYSALRRCADDKSLVLVYVGMALSFVTLTVPIQMDGQWMTVAWASEALLLLWLGFRTRIPKLRPWALGIGLLSIGSLLSQSLWNSNPYQLAELKQFWNPDTVSAALVAAFMFVAAAIYAKHRDAVPQQERSMVSALVIGASLLVLYRGSIEISIFFADLAQSRLVFDVAQKPHQRTSAMWMAYQHLFQPRQMVLSAFWILFALVSVGIGIYRRFRALRLMGLLLFGVAVLKIFLIDLSQLDRIYRILSFLILGAVLLVTSFFYQRYKDRIRDFALKD